MEFIKSSDQQPPLDIPVFIHPPQKHWNGELIYVATLRKEGIYKNMVYVQENSAYQANDYKCWAYIPSP